MQLNQSEREFVIEQVSPIIKVIKIARGILYSTWDEFFSYEEQRTINCYDAERIGEMLYAVDELITNSIREYADITGDNAFHNLDDLQRQHHDQSIVFEVVELHEKLYTALRGKPFDHPMRKKQTEISKMEDYAAIPHLRKLLEEAKLNA